MSQRIFNCYQKVIPSSDISSNIWSGCLIENLAVVHVIQATYCKNSHLMHLVQLLVFFAAYFNFWFSVSHSARKNQIWGLMLSRNKHATGTRGRSEANGNVPSTHKPSDSKHHMDMHNLDGAVQHYFTAALA